MYYQELNGDYLQVDIESEHYYRRLDENNACYEGRAACLPHRPDLISETVISKSYLKSSCKKVDLEDIPENWRTWLER